MSLSVEVGLDVAAGELFDEFGHHRAVGKANRLGDEAEVSYWYPVVLPQGGKATARAATTFSHDADDKSAVDLPPRARQPGCDGEAEAQCQK